MTNKKRTFEDAKKQAVFCDELMNRLLISFKTAKEKKYAPTAENYTQMQADIIRLRRELNTLRKMLSPWEVQG